MCACSRQRQEPARPTSELEREAIDAAEVFEHLRDITDPEHPYTLEQLNVLDLGSVQVDDARGHVR